jgi:hypothetical protein
MFSCVSFASWHAQQLSDNQNSLHMFFVKCDKISKVLKQPKKWSSTIKTHDKKRLFFIANDFSNSLYVTLVQKVVCIMHFIQYITS